MTNQLAQVVKVRIGSPFRERIVHAPRGKYLVVQGKDVGSDGNLILDGMVRIAEAPSKRAPDILAAGEVVFQTRGVSYRAAIVPDADAPMLAAGSLFILSPDTARVSPNILSSFKSTRYPSGASPDGDRLNHPESAAFRNRADRSAAT